MQKPCRICEDFSIDGTSIRETIDAYLQSLPEESWVDAAAYDARLALCEACVHLRGGTCALCGCFVRARAAKWFMACPDAKQPKWEKCPR